MKRGEEELARGGERRYNSPLNPHAVRNGEAGRDGRGPEDKGRLKGEEKGS